MKEKDNLLNEIDAMRHNLRVKLAKLKELDSSAYKTWILSNGSLEIDKDLNDGDDIKDDIGVNSNNEHDDEKQNVKVVDLINEINFLKETCLTMAIIRELPKNKGYKEKQQEYNQKQSAVLRNL